MEIKIPYNIFIFIWSVAGVLILGYGFFTDIVYNERVKFDRQLFTQIVWFIIFIFYCLNYLKKKVFTKR